MQEIRVENADADAEFVILASDGVWDVVSSEQAINLVRRHLALHGDAQAAAEALLAKAIARATLDNVSVIVGVVG